jgi:hypothetical protein
MKTALWILGGIAVLAGGYVLYVRLRTPKAQLIVTPDWQSGRVNYKVVIDGRVENESNLSAASANSGINAGLYEVRIQRQAKGGSILLFVKGRLADKKTIDFSAKTLS